MGKTTKKELEMARTDYFPPREADFDGWFGNFVVRHALAEREGRVGTMERGSAYGGGVIIHRDGETCLAETAMI